MTRARLEALEFNIERRLMTAASYKNAATKRPDLWAHLLPIAARWEKQCNRILTKAQAFRRKHP